jgi:hypothetical protein
MSLPSTAPLQEDCNTSVSLEIIQRKGESSFLKLTGPPGVGNTAVPMSDCCSPGSCPSHPNSRASNPGACGNAGSRERPCPPGVVAGSPRSKISLSPVSTFLTPQMSAVCQEGFCEPRTTASSPPGMPHPPTAVAESPRSKTSHPP